MRKTEYSTISDGCGSINSENKTIKPNNSWKTVSSIHESEEGLSNHSALISLANEKMRLDSILKDRNIILNFSDVSPAGWIRIQCPLPDHNDNTPSFGYNVNTDSFNCFGCHRGGGSIQFLSIVENKSPILLAKEILLSSTSIYDLITEIENYDPSEVDQLLISFSDVVRSFIHNSDDKKQALQLVENLTWSLDVYMQKHALTRTSEVDTIKSHINIIQNILEECANG